VKHPNVPNFAPNGVRLPELSLVKSRAYRPLIGELQAHPLRGDGSLTLTTDTASLDEGYIALRLSYSFYFSLSVHKRELH
jgi:hypothetical protein